MCYVIHSILDFIGFRELIKQKKAPLQDVEKGKRGAFKTPLKTSDKPCQQTMCLTSWMHQ